MSGFSRWLMAVMGVVCFCAVVQSEGGRDLYSDTWVATDALGRELGGFEEYGPPRQDKYVAIFYWTWHKPGRSGPYDVSKIIAANPDNPKWGPFAAYHWGEPELGYYITTDPYVLRKHASMLSDAGVDAIFFDTTNPPWTWKESYMVLCETYRQIRSQGGKTPQICFIAPFGPPKVIVEKVYKELYGPGLYPELWFRWEGKPLILADKSQIDNAKIREFFRFRKPMPSYFAGPSDANQWGWLEVYPQHRFYDSQGNTEQVTVGIAQNAAHEKLAPMSHKDGAYGRSWHNGHKDPRPDAVNYGYNFIEQWQRALKLDPQCVFITGWNEWVAGRYKEWAGYTSKDVYYPNAVFVDEYNQEYSRDIEPMKGGHTDSYYYLMADYIRRFKGVRPPRPASGPKTIRIDGRFRDWDDVKPEFRDTIGDTAHRDHPGYGDTHYTNTTGRNDIVAAKVARDGANYFFYVETHRPITAHTDSNWMLLFIDIDQNHNTGWEGYDYLINHQVINGRTTTVKKNTGGWNWQRAGTAAYAVAGNRMELALPYTLVGPAAKQGRGLDFHWADNIQKGGNIIEFAVSGDSAPNRRFNYRYHQ